MITLLLFMVEKQHLLIRRVANQNVSEQGFQYAQAVNAWAERVLIDDANRQVDHLREDWARFGRPDEELEQLDSENSFSLDLSSQQDEEKEEQAVIDFGFDGLEYTIDDLQAKYNLNNLSSRNVNDVNTQKRIFLNLLRVLEVGEFDDERERLYGALRDWVDENQETTPNGFESNDYRVKKTPYYAADQKLSSIGELRFIEGFTQEIINKLKPYVTVLPVDNARVNLNTVSAEVLGSLSGAPIVELGSVRTLLANRLNPAFQGFQSGDIQGAETAIIGVNPVGAQPAPNMIQVNSQFFQINTKVTLGDYVYCMKTVVLREPLSQSGTTPRVSVLSREHDTLCKDEIIIIEDSDEDLS